MKYTTVTIEMRIIVVNKIPHHSMGSLLISEVRIFEVTNMAKAQHIVVNHFAMEPSSLLKTCASFSFLML